MNPNRVPNSPGASGPGPFYTGTDSSAQMMQMQASNSMLPGALYPIMDKNSVDWGALAQQWRQMREQWSQPAADFIPSPPPPPSFSDSSEQYLQTCTYDSGDTLLAYGGPTHHQPSKAFEEQGEAPMEVEKEDDNPADAPVLLSGSAPSHTLVNPNASAAVANWQAKMNQLLQMDLSHRDTVRAGPSMSTENKSAQFHGLMSRDVKLTGGCSGDAGPPTLNGGKDAFSVGSVPVNETKTKVLPAWIREGLEKMEREKQRQLEREQEQKTWEEEQRRQRSVNEDGFGTWSPARREISATQERTANEDDDPDMPVPSPDATSENLEDQAELLAIAVRKTLTEILLEETGIIINNIASAAIRKQKKRKGKMVHLDTRMLLY